MSNPVPPPGRPRPKTPTAAPQQFEFELRHSGRSAAWLVLRGDLDLESGSQFGELAEQVLASALLLIIDLRELGFIDSVGIHELIKADARARRSGRRLVLIRGVGQVDRVFELVGLPDCLDIIDLKPILLRAPERPESDESAGL